MTTTETKMEIGEIHEVSAGAGITVLMSTISILEKNDILKAIEIALGTGVPVDTNRIINEDDIIILQREDAGMVGVVLHVKHEGLGNMATKVIIKSEALDNLLKKANM